MTQQTLRALALVATALGAPAFAQDSAAFERQGFTQVFTNDWFGMPIGDRFDRWRTGAYQVSGFFGQDWDGALPSDPFALVELRFRGEIIAPDNLAAPAPGDRRYAPALYFGASTHFDYRGLEVAAGADLVMTGDQTGLMDLHDGIHRTFGGSDVDLSNFMIDDGYYLNGTVEGGRTFALGNTAVRPFAEVQAGVETLARVGVDLRFGNFDPEALLIRDPITGQRILALPGDGGGGFSFSAGADVGYVWDSVLLPSNGPEHEDMRYRLRGGVNYGIGPADFFYGVTYLSEEFVGQEEGQLVGSLSLVLRF
ncbi:lipid A-modifier LpxR family protein [Hasllibacter sp. MH4015]|uniref:lipid A-modifier LpxR family protein n=1 Tax=Hasllibacter sp. MH4015 TaxID=2854029 RepID=UPI001CD497A1|nr:lipid A-modifier LpxR family protein [Hasllibacter sp. MH4015]